MPKSRINSTPAAAVDDVFDGASILISGFAAFGWPESLLLALQAKGVGQLTCICHGFWTPNGSQGSFAYGGLDGLIVNGQVRKLISPLPFYPGQGGAVLERWRSGDLEVEVIPQGTLAERLRAGGAGLGGVYLRTGVGTRFTQGKEVRRFGNDEYVLEPGLRADFALLRARAADSIGNLLYDGTGRNWNPAMATASRVAIAEVDQILEPGGIDPETVITPGIFVQRIVQTL